MKPITPEIDEHSIEILQVLRVPYFPSTEIATHF